MCGRGICISDSLFWLDHVTIWNVQMDLQHVNSLHLDSQYEFTIYMNLPCHIMSLSRVNEFPELRSRISLVGSV
jgi:hypothetical protein